MPVPASSSRSLSFADAAESRPVESAPDGSLPACEDFEFEDDSAGPRRPLVGERDGQPVRDRDTDAEGDGEPATRPTYLPDRVAKRWWTGFSASLPRQGPSARYTESRRRAPPLPAPYGSAARGDGPPNAQNTPRQASLLSRLPTKAGGGVVTGESCGFLAAVAAQQRHGDSRGGASDHSPHRSGVLPALEFGDPIDVHEPTMSP